MIKTIVFDVGNIVWQFRPLYEKLIILWGQMVGCDLEQFRLLYQAEYLKFELGQSKAEDWLYSLNPKISKEEYLSCLPSVFGNKTVFFQYVNSDIIALLKHLRSQKIPLGSLSNTENFFAPYMDQHISPFFDYQLLSDRLGLRKPDPLIYQEIFKHVDCKPNEVIFIDDKPENITGAKNLNINALLFTGYSQLLKDLSSYLPREVLSISPTPTVTGTP